MIIATRERQLATEDNKNLQLSNHRKLVKRNSIAQLKIFNLLLPKLPYHYFFFLKPFIYFIELVGVRCNGLGHNTH